MTVTERVFNELTDRGLTQVALAEAIGYTTSTLNYVFKNGKEFGADSVMKIAAFFGKSPIWVLTGEEEKPIIQETIREVERPLTVDEQELLSIFNGLDREGRITLLYQAYQQRTRCRTDAQEKEKPATSA